MHNLGPLKSHATAVLQSCADGYRIVNLSIPNLFVFGSILVSKDQYLHQSALIWSKHLFSFNYSRILLRYLQDLFPASWHGLPTHTHAHLGTMTMANLPHPARCGEDFLKTHVQLVIKKLKKRLLNEIGGVIVHPTDVFQQRRKTCSIATTRKFTGSSKSIREHESKLDWQLCFSYLFK